MNEAYDFLQKCRTFFLATEEYGQPRVRPFGALSRFEGKLYIETNNQKKVYRQLVKNGKVELCGMHEGKWIRVAGTLKEDPWREVLVAMLEGNPSLKSLAGHDNGTMTVFYFEGGMATVYSFTEGPKVIALYEACMATSKEYADYVLDQLLLVDGSTSRKMMGEYLL